MIIKSILVTAVAPMRDHIANAGEKHLGNFSSIKRRPDERVYISGQKQRHALFAAMDRLNESHNGTYVSNGDGVTTVVEKDLRADLGGYLDTAKESYSGRRTAPLTATPAVALEPSKIGQDLLIRLKVTADESSRGQALATREYSQSDDMVMSFHIDVGAVSIRRLHTYEKEKHIGTHFVKHCDEDERRRRIALAIEASGCLTDYANNARNATSAEPSQVLIVFDTRISRKAARFFSSEATERERTLILDEIKDRGGIYFQGDDKDENQDSVAQAYQKALKFLRDEVNPLLDPSNGAEIKSTADFEGSLKPAKKASK